MVAVGEERPTGGVSNFENQVFPFTLDFCLKVNFFSLLLTVCKWVVTGLQVTFMGFPTSVGRIPLFLGVHLLDPSNKNNLEFRYCNLFRHYEN